MEVFEWSTFVVSTSGLLATLLSNEGKKALPACKGGRLFMLGILSSPLQSFIVCVSNVTRASLGEDLEEVAGEGTPGGRDE